LGVEVPEWFVRGVEALVLLVTVVEETCESFVKSKKKNENVVILI
jgi:hypothetical protein